MSEAKTLPPMPDRLCTDPRSPYYLPAVIEQDVGIRFNDRERHDVAEYCISEGWVRVPAGKTVDRKGNPLMIKLKGKVEAFYRAAEAAPTAPGSAPTSAPAPAPASPGTAGPA